MHAGEGREALGKVLQGLTGYVGTHFAFEERMMRERGYPDFSMHKRKHEKMTRKVMEIQNDFDAGKIISPVQVSNFLKGWLQKHIMETDKLFGDFSRSSADPMDRYSEP